MPGTAYIVSQAEEPTAAPRSGEGSWFLSVAKRFRKQVVQLFAITLITNLLALAMPLFIMAVYDRVIGASSLKTLAYLLIGVAVGPGP